LHGAKKYCTDCSSDRKKLNCAKTAEHYILEKLEDEPDANFEHLKHRVKHGHYEISRVLPYRIREVSTKVYTD
jgi:hypothetical protein